MDGLGIGLAESEPRARSLPFLRKASLAVARSARCFLPARRHLQVTPHPGAADLLVEFHHEVNGVVASPVDLVDVSAEVSAGHPSRRGAMVRVYLDVCIRGPHLGVR